MSQPQDTTAFACLARKIAPDGTLVRAWPLHGGISAQVTAIELATGDGQRQTLVVRQHGPVDLARNPHIARDEFRLLQALHVAGLPVPPPIYLDESGELFAAPVVVVGSIEGASIFALNEIPDLIPQFARQLALIHQVDYARHDLAFLPQRADLWAAKLGKPPADPDDTLSQRRMRETLTAVWPLPQRNAVALLHGDFWPGNILWRAGRLVGVIDWEDAALGDPLADLANSRLETIWAFGHEAMERFTEEYLSLAPCDTTHLPYWDLCAALRHAPNIGKIAADEADASRLRERHRAFVAQAFARLALR